MPAPPGGPPVLFLHGFWHGSWCWTEVLASVTSAGVRALAVDMAGHGLRARRPAAATGRPFDQELLAAEVSPVAAVDLDQAGDLLVSQVKRLGGGGPVAVVAHSMGGAVLTRAGQQVPDLIAHAVYVAAFMPASDVPAAAYVRMPENEGSRAGSLRSADARVVRALRMDVASPDPAYRAAVRLGLDPAHLRAVHQGPHSPPGAAAEIHRRRGRRVPRQPDDRPHAGVVPLPLPVDAGPARGPRPGDPPRITRPPWAPLPKDASVMIPPSGVIRMVRSCARVG